MGPEKLQRSFFFAKSRQTVLRAPWTDFDNFWSVGKLCFSIFWKRFFLINADVDFSPPKNRHTPWFGWYTAMFPNQSVRVRSYNSRFLNWCLNSANAKMWGDIRIPRNWGEDPFEKEIPVTGETSDKIPNQFTSEFRKRSEQSFPCIWLWYRR